MANQTLSNVTLQIRRDTAQGWATANPILSAGELGFETDTGESKCGDGTTTWNNLPYLYALPSHTHTSADRTYIAKKTYTDLYANPNNFAGGTFYFAKVIPDNYYKPWKVVYRVHAYVPNQVNYDGYYIVTICGCQNIIPNYIAYNSFYSTSYRPLYSHIVYRAKQEGATTYGHLLGERIYSATNGNSASYKRTLEVELLLQENCNVTLFDNVTLYANAQGTGTTNYDTYSELNGYDNGVKMTGDANTQGYYTLCYNTKYFRTAVTKESIAVGDSTGYAQATAGVTFDISYPMIWTTVDVAAGGTNYANTFVRNYDRNLTNVKSSFVGTPRSMVYLVVTLSGNIATIDNEIITDTLPTTEDGKVYIAIGRLGNQSNGKNYFIFQETHPMYYYKDGAMHEYAYIPSDYVKDTDLSTVATSGSYNDLTNKPTIPTVPTNISTFTNDSGYITSAHEINNNRNIEYIVGTQSASTGAWTGVTQDTELYEGKRILYYLPFGGNGNATLELTYPDGTTTGAQNCYYMGTTRLTTHYGAGNVIPLTYVSGKGWMCDPNYDQNTYDRTLLNDVRVYAGTNGIKQYSIIMQKADGTWESPTTTHGTGTSKAKNTSGFLLGKIWRYNTSNNINSGALTTNDQLYDCQPFDLRYSTNCGTTLVERQSVYLVGTIGSDGLFYLDDTWWTQTLPTTEDGKVYIYLGDAYSTSSIFLVAYNPIYEYRNGAFRLYSNSKRMTTSDIDEILGTPL